MGNVVEWALKLSTGQFVAPAKGVVDAVKAIDSAAASAAPDVAALGKGLDNAATAAAKAAGIYRDALGRIHDANGKFLKKSALAGVDFDALPLAQPKSSKLDVPNLAGDGVASWVEHLKELRAAAAAASKVLSPLESHLQKAIPTSLMQAPKKLGAFARAVQMVGRNFGGGAARGLLQLGAGLEKVQEIAAVAGPPLLAVGGAAIAAGAGAAFAAGSFVSSVVHAQALREDITKGLAITLKSKAAADDAIRVASEAADMVGVKRSDAALQYQQLLQKGFDIQKTDTIFKRLADLRATDPSADMAGLTRVIGQIASTGRLQGDELNELANAGLETGAVYDALGKKLGKTRAEIIKLKEAGKIDSDTAIAGILDAITAQTGGRAAGQVAQEQARTSMSGLLSRFSNIPNNFLFSVGVDKELGTVKAGMNEFLDYFEATGKGSAKISTAIEGTFSALVKGFLGVDVEKEGGITKTIDKILDAVIASKPQIEEFAKNMRTVFDVGVGIAGFVADVIALKDSLSDLGPVGTVLEYVVFGPLALARDAVWGIVAAAISLKDVDLRAFFEGIGESVLSFGTTLYTGGMELATNIINGLVDGITSNATRFIDSMGAVARGGLSMFDFIYKIGSPSKVMEQRGAWTMEGLEIGVARNDTGAQDAMASAVEPPDLSAITAGAQQAGAAAFGGSSINVGGVVIHVDAKGATAADAQRIGEQVSEQVLRTLETLAIQMGAAA